MRNFFVDLENVKHHGLEGIDNLKKTDYVYIFFSSRALNLPIDLYRIIDSSNARVKFIEIKESTPNAMDFYIVSLIGVFIGRRRKGIYNIISKDNGFNAAIGFLDNYLEKYDFAIQKFVSIKQSINLPKSEKIEIDKNKIEPDDKKKLKHCNNEGEVKKCNEFIDKVLKLNKNKVDLHNYLVKDLGKEKGLVLYNLIKSRYKK